MGFYAGSTEPVAAADVAIGDLLVHDQADTGYLKVTDTRNDGKPRHRLLHRTADRSRARRRARHRREPRLPVAGPRAGGRVEKILKWEGDRLHEGQVIVQLDASELRARRDLAAAQIDTASHDADAQEAQLVFLHDDAGRQQELLRRRVVSSTDAERADSADHRPWHGCNRRAAPRFPGSNRSR